ncbi:MAG: hypothetical protein O3A46_11040 [Candidatus Poribacteria bacterium]|nr:hypothetical protein [Candidatus Poribacteria bacterium]
MARVLWMILFAAIVVFYVYPTDTLVELIGRNESRSATFDYNTVIPLRLV